MSSPSPSLSTSTLPASAPSQTYVSISAFPAGYITLPESVFISPADPDARRTVPSLAFLITHPGGTLTVPTQTQPDSINSTTPGPFRLLFDLGLRSDPANYIPQLASHLAARQPVTHRPSARETLASGSVSPTSISAVIISHVHWDHHGDPADFPAARFVVGPGATQVLEHGLPGRGAHSHFDPALFAPCPRGYVEVASPEETNGASIPAWKPLGPFPATLDLFGDGAVYLVDAPGHLPGHVNLLCRTADQKWVYLGGDAYHDTRLLTGERQIATWVDPCGSGMVLSFHIDRDKALQSIERIRRLIKMAEEGGEDVEVVVAHDDGWLEANKQRLFPEVL